MFLAFCVQVLRCQTGSTLKEKHALDGRRAIQYLGKGLGVTLRGIGIGVQRKKRTPGLRRCAFNRTNVLRGVWFRISLGQNDSGSFISTCQSPCKSLAQTQLYTLRLSPIFLGTCKSSQTPWGKMEDGDYAHGGLRILLSWCGE